MEVTDRIIAYLTETYKPDGIIVYGSFADGSAGENSDFDALVIADHTKAHDASVIGSTVLDVFVYPPETFGAAYDPEEFIQVFDGKVILDRSGLGTRLKERVRAHVDRMPGKTAAEIQQSLDWCEKMLSRTARGDAEGYYRWHWLLIDSLEIYTDIRGLRYFGPKKALRAMEKSDAEAFRRYSRALKALDRECLSEWVAFLRHAQEGAKAE